MAKRKRVAPAIPEPNPSSRLKYLDALIERNGGVNPLDQPPPMIERNMQRLSSVDVEITELRPFRRHPFRLYEGERLYDMVESIRANGVLVPIIVRTTDMGLEILAGHNRVNAARLAGLKKVPAIILERLSDEDAWIYVIETNLMQRSFSDMSHTEKAAVIATHHSKLFSPGKRNDILERLHGIENPRAAKKSGDSTNAKRATTLEKIGMEYSLSKDTIARYLRIHRLSSALKARLDHGDFAFLSAVSLSFLNKSEQATLDWCMDSGDYTLDMKKADILRRYAESDGLNEDTISRILRGELGQKPKPNRTPVVKIQKAVYARYFGPDQEPREIEEIVELALEMYFKGSPL